MLLQTYNILLSSFLYIQETKINKPYKAKDKSEENLKKTVYVSVPETLQNP